MIFLTMVELLITWAVGLFLFLEVVWPLCTGGHLFPALRRRFKSQEQQLLDAQERLHQQALAQQIAELNSQYDEQQEHIHYER